jgi:hypothetical protein
VLSKLRAHLTYANVMATVAVFIALGGSTYAAITVTGKNVKDSSLTGKDIKNSSLTTSDIKNRSLLARDFKAGQLPAGPTGPKGPTGPPGQPGASGLSGREVVTSSSSFDSVSSKATFTQCPRPKKVISFGWDVTGGKTGGSPDEKLDIVPDHVSVDPQHEVVDVGAYEVTGTAQNWSVQAIALCANP